MKNKNVLICIIVGLVLMGLVCISSFSIMTPQENNSTSEVNLTLNNTNDTNNTTTSDPVKTSNNKKSSSKKSSDDDIYYDEELNAYFDSNDKSVYEGQFEKGTSKSEMREILNEIGN